MGAFRCCMPVRNSGSPPRWAVCPDLFRAVAACCLLEENKKKTEIGFLILHTRHGRTVRVRLRTASFLSPKRFRYLYVRFLRCVFLHGGHTTNRPYIYICTIYMLEEIARDILQFTCPQAAAVVRVSSNRAWSPGESGVMGGAG